MSASHDDTATDGPRAACAAPPAALDAAASAKAVKARALQKEVSELRDAMAEIKAAVLSMKGMTQQLAQAASAQLGVAVDTRHLDATATAATAKLSSGLDSLTNRLDGLDVRTAAAAAATSIETAAGAADASAAADSATPPAPAAADSVTAPAPATAGDPGRASRIADMLSQVVFSGLAQCPRFEPNRLRPNMCASCFKLLTRHAAAAVTHDEAALRLALDYSAHKSATPSVVLAAGECAHAPRGSLLLGGCKAVSVEGGVDKLRGLGVDAIVKTAGGLEAFFPSFGRALQAAEASGMSVLRLGWRDKTDFVLPPAELAAAAVWIGEAMRRGGGVYVLCAMGKSRSTTAVLAYMLAAESAVLGDDAVQDRGPARVARLLARVRQKRPMAGPNDAFMEQLGRLDAEGFFAGVLDSSGGDDDEDERR